MFQRFFPNEYYDSTYHIDFQAFYDKGYRAVLFDCLLYTSDAADEEDSVNLGGTRII